MVGNEDLICGQADRCQRLRNVKRLHGDVLIHVRLVVDGDVGLSRFVPMDDEFLGCGAFDALLVSCRRFGGCCSQRR